MDLRVGKNYQLIKKIGSGAFGEIYEGKSLHILLFRQARYNQAASCNQVSKTPPFFNLIGANQVWISSTRVWNEALQGTPGRK